MKERRSKDTQVSWGAGGGQSHRLAAIPGGVVLGAVSEMSWDHGPFPLPRQHSPEAHGTSGGQVSLRFLLVSVLVLLASRATRQLCQGASFPVTPRGRPLVPLAARGSETELRFALSVCILVSWGLGMCLQASSYLSVTGTVTGA